MECSEWICRMDGEEWLVAECQYWLFDEIHFVTFVRWSVGQNRGRKRGQPDWQERNRNEKKQSIRLSLHFGQSHSGAEYRADSLGDPKWNRKQKVGS